MKFRLVWLGTAVLSSAFCGCGGKDQTQLADAGNASTPNTAVSTSGAPSAPTAPPTTPAAPPAPAQEDASTTNADSSTETSQAAPAANRPSKPSFGAASGAASTPPAGGSGSSRPSFGSASGGPSSPPAAGASAAPARPGFGSASGGPPSSNNNPQPPNTPASEGPFPGAGSNTPASPLTMSPPQPIEMSLRDRAVEAFRAGNATRAYALFQAHGLHVPNDEIEIVTNNYRWDKKRVVPRYGYKFAVGLVVKKSGNVTELKPVGTELSALGGAGNGGRGGPPGFGGSSAGSSNIPALPAKELSDAAGKYASMFIDAYRREHSEGHWSEAFREYDLGANPATSSGLGGFLGSFGGAMGGQGVGPGSVGGPGFGGASGGPPAGYGGGGGGPPAGYGGGGGGPPAGYGGGGGGPPAGYGGGGGGPPAGYGGGGGGAPPGYGGAGGAPSSAPGGAPPAGGGTKSGGGGSGGSTDDSVLYIAPQEDANALNVATGAAGQPPTGRGLLGNTGGPAGPAPVGPSGLNSPAGFGGPGATAPPSGLPPTGFGGAEGGASAPFAGASLGGVGMVGGNPSDLRLPDGAIPLGPGLTYIGSGEALGELTKKANDMHYDALVVFEVDVSFIRANGTTKNDCRIRVVNLRADKDTKEKSITSSSLNNTEVAKDKNPDAKIESTVSTFMKRMIEAYPLDDLPNITADAVKTKRLAALGNDQVRTKLDLLSEVQLYFSKGLIDETTRLDVFGQIAGGDGRILAAGTPEEKLAVLEKMIRRETE